MRYNSCSSLSTIHCSSSPPAPLPAQSYHKFKHHLTQYRQQTEAKPKRSYSNFDCSTQYWNSSCKFFSAS